MEKSFVYMMILRSLRKIIKILVILRQVVFVYWTRKNVKSENLLL